jgi:hypothetical protein
VAAVVVAGGVLNLFCLLLLPFRLGGHLVPAGPLLVLVVNAAIGSGANRLSGARVPAQVLMGLALMLSVLAALRGPGGDVLVTADLQAMYLLFVLGALLGAAIPLFRRDPGRPGQARGE